ncbi:MAG TPA: patatin-like phospholipase family protein [Bacteroidales bacterium]|nr:patatin-like phospholipase family protein [Bacteroidales bacterium]
MKKYKIGIALGGGGARGFAHLGVLKALEERGIKPDIISGASAGSIVGGFYADKKTPEEIFKIIKEKGFFKYTNFNIPKTGLVGLEGLEKQIDEDLSVENIEDLAVPFFAAVTNLNAGRVEYFDKGDASSVIKASSAIPVLFSPVEMNGALYADGGILDNVPVAPLSDICEKTIAVDISPLTEMKTIENLFQIALRTFQLSVNKSSKDLEKRCDLLISLEECSRFDLLNTNNAKELYDIGYDYVMNADLTPIKN